jgi:uncharacterized repeat protein (TIGR03803 family)
MRQNSFLRIIMGLFATLAVTFALGGGAWAQVKYKTLHRFEAVANGRMPNGGLVLDAAGNLYGTTSMGGTGCPDCGTVFKLTPNSNGDWTESVLYSFQDLNYANFDPIAGLVFDGAGNLYGGTYRGGGRDYCCGTVYELTPNSDGSWTDTVLDAFVEGDPQGSLVSGPVIFDTQGALYGTVLSGASRARVGGVFKLYRSSGGRWRYSKLYAFTGGDGGDASYPGGGLVFDAAGNLYGMASGFWFPGIVFKLTRGSEGEWTETTLHEFTGGDDGAYAVGPLIFDAAGNLYGGTSGGGSYGYGNIFKLTPNSDGSWTESVVHQFTGEKDGGVPSAGLILDAAGNLYSTTQFGGDLACQGSGGHPGCGVVFKLSPLSNGSWKFRVLHIFLDGHSEYPVGLLTLDGAGNLYGTTQGDGAKILGSVFEITP